MRGEVLLEAKGLEKSFGATKVLSGVDLTVGEGEFVTLLGPSGCGKTTTLRILAGFTDPDSGTVRLAGRDITSLPPEERDINTVFQSYALFPHMNVEKNIAYGLKLRGVSKAAQADKVREMLRLVQLEGFEKRMPAELSGGQRQRVAIARSVVLGPRLLLLDEPLGALDRKLREVMQFELKQLQGKLGIAFVYITHDQEEALNMSDRVAVMHNGVIGQIGTPDEVYNYPTSRFTAAFIGQSTLLDAFLARSDGDGCVLSVGEETVPGRRPASSGEGKQVTLCLRCERVRVTRERQGSASLKGVLLSHQSAGGTVRREVALPDGRVIRSIREADGPADGLRVGDGVFVSWDPAYAAIVPGEGEAK